ncbi:MAG: hypothetical protein H6810_06795 [Phycisphaeraceae bacterium]|nr:MAG: hypothetical protein H6810_06795 [Phycisphaeraceae bacterium]
MPTEQPAPGGVQPSVAPAADESTTPAGSPRPAEPGGVFTPSEALAVFGTIRGWVDAGRVPDEPDVTMPVSWVATVVLRQGGQIVGRDTAVAGDAAEASGILQRAATRALRRAVSRFEGEPDALRPERIRRGLAESRLSIELAPQPAVPVSGDVGLTNLDEWVRPGIEGMLVRHGSGAAAMTPGLMLATDRTPSGAYVALVAELADDPAIALNPGDELFAKGYALSLFNVVQVAQIEPGGSPLMLHRGGKIAGPVASAADLRALADAIAGHIMARAWPGVERNGLRGDLDPVAGRFDPAVAPPFAQAFAAESLLRYADTAGIDAAMAQRARSAAEATLASLAVVEPAERAPWGDAISSAACLVALSRLDKLGIERSDELRALRDNCLRQVDAAYNSKAGFDPMIPETARGVVCRGLVAMAGFRPWDREALLGRADEAIRTAFRETPRAHLLGLMPDLGWADIELSRMTGGEVKSAAALRDLRETVLGLKLRASDLIAVDRDLQGGLVLDAEGSPLPTWQSLRPTGLLAAMLGDGQLTPGTIGTGEVRDQLIQLLDLLRFVKQLAAEERLCHMYADPDLAIGGVRVSLWDQHMPLAASAIGLASVCETLDSIDRIANRQPAAAGRP